MSGTGQILKQEGRAEERDAMKLFMYKASQLRNEGITDIEKYRDENIPDDIAIIFINIKP